MIALERFYVAVVERGVTRDQGFGVVFPDLPGCVSAGDTVDSAVHGAAEALALFAEAVEEHGGILPEPGPVDAPSTVDGAAEVVRVLVPLLRPERQLVA